MKWGMRFEKWAAYGFLLLILFLIQTTIFDSFVVMGVRPHLTLIALVAVAMFEHEVAGSIFGMAAGFLIDTLYGGVRGFYFLMLMLMGAFLGAFSRVYIKPSLFHMAILTALSSLLYNFLIFVTHIDGISFLSGLTSRIIPEMVYTLAFTAPIYFAVKYLNGRLAPEETD